MTNPISSGIIGFTDFSNKRGAVLEAKVPFPLGQSREGSGGARHSLQPELTRYESSGKDICAGTVQAFFNARKSIPGFRDINSPTFRDAASAMQRAHEGAGAAAYFSDYRPATTMAEDEQRGEVFVKFGHEAGEVCYELPNGELIARDSYKVGTHGRVVLNSDFDGPRLVMRDVERKAESTNSEMTTWIKSKINSPRDVILCQLVGKPRLFGGVADSHAMAIASGENGGYVLLDPYKGLFEIRDEDELAQVVNGYEKKFQSLGMCTISGEGSPFRDNEDVRGLQSRLNAHRSTPGSNFRGSNKESLYASVEKYTSNILNMFSEKDGMNLTHTEMIKIINSDHSPEGKFIASMMKSGTGEYLFNPESREKFVSKLNCLNKMMHAWQPDRSSDMARSSETALSGFFGGSAFFGSESRVPVDHDGGVDYDGHASLHSSNARELFGSESLASFGPPVDEAKENNLVELERAIREYARDKIELPPESKFSRFYPDVGGHDSLISTPVSSAHSDVLVGFINKWLPNEKVDNSKSISDLLNATSIKSFAGLSTEGAHGYGHSYSDESIMKVLAQVENKKDISKVDGKTVLLQRGTRGCTAAVTAMLAGDHKRELNDYQLARRNMGGTDTMVADLKKYNLDPIVTMAKDMDELKDRIQEHGPAIVTVGSGVGNHVVIVDHVEPNYVTVRDPAHGWMINVNRNNFDSSIQMPSKIIQCMEPMGRNLLDEWLNKNGV